MFIEINGMVINTDKITALGKIVPPNGSYFQLELGIEAFYFDTREELEDCFEWIMNQLQCNSYTKYKYLSGKGTNIK